MMIAMKATVYGLREDERPLFAKEAERFPEIELVLTKEYVTEDSAALAEGADAILITAPCTITPALARRLHGAGVRYILTRNIMKKSAYSGKFGDYSSYSDEYDELSEDAEDADEE